MLKISGHCVFFFCPCLGLCQSLFLDHGPFLCLFVALHRSLVRPFTACYICLLAFFLSLALCLSWACFSAWIVYFSTPASLPVSQSTQYLLTWSRMSGKRPQTKWSLRCAWYMPFRSVCLRGWTVQAAFSFKDLGQSAEVTCHSLFCSVFAGSDLRLLEVLHRPPWYVLMSMACKRTACSFCHFYHPCVDYWWFGGASS